MFSSILIYNTHLFYFRSGSEYKDMNIMMKLKKLLLRIWRRLTLPPWIYQELYNPHRMNKAFGDDRAISTLMTRALNGQKVSED